VRVDHDGRVYLPTKGPTQRRVEQGAAGRGSSPATFGHGHRCCYYYSCTTPMNAFIHLLQSRCCSASPLPALDTTARLPLLATGMASLHKSTCPPATSPVWACGSCLPGMLALTWGRTKSHAHGFECAQQATLLLSLSCRSLCCPCCVTNVHHLYLRTLTVPRACNCPASPTSLNRSPRCVALVISRSHYKQL
jgi:hypothetical protein